MFDRAMQVLYTFALEPIAETTSDRKSFAYRKGRSALDAHATIMNILKKINRPKWFLICDVTSYYDSISHKWLLNHIPMNKQVLQEFLKSGMILKDGLFKTEVGISLGCSISPILGNMTLDGLQKLLYELQGTTVVDYLDGSVIRYSDDILVTARTKEKAEIYLKNLKNLY